ncbi:flagellar motor protein MotB, partial [Acinetobacter baumannii]
MSLALDDDLPDLTPSRPIWLMTLADLALLLVGFFVLLQASQQLDRAALARGLRAGFGVRD